MIRPVDVAARNHVVVMGRGEGPVVVLSHGFGCDQNMWRLVVACAGGAIRRSCCSTTWEREGRICRRGDEQRYRSLHGYADDVLEILRELDLRRVVFVGHSVSAMIGVLAAGQEPERFAGLVLLTPSPRYIDDGDYRGGFSATDIDELLESLESNYLGWSAAMAPVIMGNPDRPELGQELTNSFCGTDPHIARVFARATFLSDNRADLASVSVPTLDRRVRRRTRSPRGRSARSSTPGSLAAGWSLSTPPDTARSSALPRPLRRRSPPSSPTSR